MSPLEIYSRLAYLNFKIAIFLTDSLDIYRELKEVSI